MSDANYVKSLKDKMHSLARLAYVVARSFPKEELFGASSQLRRAALSVPLNFIEGYARKRRAVKLNFWETSYGSLKETQYLIYFALSEKWIEQTLYDTIDRQCDEVGAMLWRAITALDSTV